MNAPIPHEYKWPQGTDTGILILGDGQDTLRLAIDGKLVSRAQFEYWLSHEGVRRLSAEKRKVWWDMLHENTKKP